MRNGAGADKEVKHPVVCAHCPSPTDEQRLGNTASEPLTDEERDAIREYYRSLTFKELLAVCPIDGIDLMRSRELPRSTEL